MALPLTDTDKFLLLHALGAPETRDRVVALLDLAGTGNVSGPASATNNALVRFDGTTGALVQSSTVTVDNSGNLAGVTQLSSTNYRVGDGTISAPAYSFTSDTNTGIYHISNDRFMLSAGAVNVLQIDATLGTSSFLQLATQDGTAANPGFTFNSDRNTGLFLVGSDSIGFATGGVNRLTIDATGIVTLGTLTLNPTSKSIAYVNAPASGEFNFRTDSGSVITQTYSITPSTAVDGITFTTPLFTLNGSSKVVTIGQTGTTAIHRINSGTATAAADVLTLLNGPTGTAGNPDLYLKININGTDYAIPAWAV